MEYIALFFSLILPRKILYVLVKALPRVCTENTVRGGRVERQIQHEAKPSAVFVSRHPPSAVFFVHTSLGGALTVI